MVVSWEFRAKIEFHRVYEYIKEGSFKNAESVRKRIYATCESLTVHPGRFPPDNTRKIITESIGASKWIIPEFLTK